MVKVLRSVYQAMIDHAIADRPNECCGLLAGRDGLITRIYQATNVAENKRTGYDVDESQLVQLFEQIRTSNVEHLGIYHSHPASDPRPSNTDRRLAYYGDVVYFIISLAHAQTRVGAFRITKERMEDEDAEVSEEPIEIVDRRPRFGIGLFA